MDFLAEKRRVSFKIHIRQKPKQNPIGKASEGEIVCVYTVHQPAYSYIGILKKYNK